MTILFVSDHYKPTVNGIVSHIVAVREELQKRGHRVIILTTKPRGKKKIREKDVYYVPSVPFLLHPTDSFALPYYPRLEKKIAKLPIDIVHNHLFITGYAGLRIARKRKIPSVVTLHTLFREYAQTLPPAKKEIVTNVFTDILARNYLDKFDGVIAPSQKAADELKRLAISSPVHLINNGIDLHTFTGPTKKTKTDITHNRPTVIITGRIAKGKNIDIAAKSILLVKKRIPNIQLIIVGDGAQRTKIEDFIVSHNLHDTIKITGFVDQETVAEITKASDLFLFTSSMDTLPTAILEAVAAGKPIVAVKNPALSETVHDGKNAIVTPLSPRKIAHAICTILSDEKKKEDFSAYSKLLSEQFSIKECASQLEALYAKMIEQKKLENTFDILKQQSRFKLHNFNVTKSVAYLILSFLLLLVTTMIYSSATTTDSIQITPQKTRLSSMVQKIKAEVTSLSDYITPYSVN